MADRRFHDPSSWPAFERATIALLVAAVGSWSLVGAAVPIIMIMRKISAWQTPRWPT